MLNVPHWDYVELGLTAAEPVVLTAVHAEIEKVVNDAMQAIYTGQQKPLVGLQEVGVRVQKLLDDYWAQVK